MTRTEIIELSNQLTERKGEKVLNLQSLYRFAVQDIAKTQRFWWRRISVSFPLTAGTKTYDLTNGTLFPSLAEIGLDEITKISVILSPSPLQEAELVPIFDPKAVIEMQINQTQVAPSRYTMNPGDYKTILIDPPDMNYTAYLMGWGMPNPGTDSSVDVVPLIPPWYHDAIVANLNWRIFKHAYGSQNPKTLDALAEYNQAMQDAQMRPQFDPNYRSQLTLSEDAVRST